jgi:RNA polymerase sigma factor (sigma-70 family)
MIRAVRQASPISDPQLIELVGQGNLEALGHLFDRYEGDVTRLIGRLGVPAGDADDLVQDTFLEVLRAAPRFDPQLPARNWLFGLAVMLVRRRRRSVSRWAAQLLQRAGLPRPEEPLTPAARLEHDQQLERFQAGFNALSAKKREVFTLVTLEGLSHDEVSRALDVPVPTVRTRLHHARQELRAFLSEGDP